MITLEESRRASGERMTTSRRAGGEQMTASRTGKGVVEDIGLLSPMTQTRKTLKPVPKVGALPAKRGRALYKGAKVSTGVGIASPLKELNIFNEGETTITPDREYWAEGWASSDGLFVIPAIKTVNMVDANGNKVKFEYSNPNGEDVLQ